MYRISAGQEREKGKREKERGQRRSRYNRGGGHKRAQTEARVRGELDVRKIKRSKDRGGLPTGGLQDTLDRIILEKRGRGSNTPNAVGPRSRRRARRRRGRGGRRRSLRDKLPKEETESILG